MEMIYFDLTVPQGTSPVLWQLQKVLC